MYRFIQIDSWPYGPRDKARAMERATAACKRCKIPLTDPIWDMLDPNAADSRKRKAVSLNNSTKMDDVGGHSSSSQSSITVTYSSGDVQKQGSKRPRVTNNNSQLFPTTGEPSGTGSSLKSLKSQFESRYSEYLRIYKLITEDKQRAAIFNNLKKQLLAEKEGSERENAILIEIKTRIDQYNGLELKKLIEKFKSMHSELALLRKKVIFMENGSSL
jgi:hypothetical protein